MKIQETRRHTGGHDGYNGRTGDPWTNCEDAAGRDRHMVHDDAVVELHLPMYRHGEHPHMTTIMDIHTHVNTNTSSYTHRIRYIHTRRFFFHRRARITRRV